MVLGPGAGRARLRYLHVTNDARHLNSFPYWPWPAIEVHFIEKSCDRKVWGTILLVGRPSIDRNFEKPQALCSLYIQAVASPPSSDRQTNGVKGAQNMARVFRMIRVGLNLKTGAVEKSEAGWVWPYEKGPE